MIEYSPISEVECGALAVELFRVWNQGEEVRKRGRLPSALLDYDVSGDVKQYLSDEARQQLLRVPISSRREATYALTKLAQDFEDGSETAEYARAKIEAAVEFAYANQRYHPIDKYLSLTLGLQLGTPVAPRLIPEDDIEKASEQAAAALKRCGFEYTSDGWRGFYNEQKLVDSKGNVAKEEVERQFRESEAVMVPIMQRTIEMDIAPEYTVKFVDEDVYWGNWTSADSNESKLLFNTNKRVASRWFTGSPERFVTHEVLGHMFQADSWRKAIKEGRINPIYGITSTPGPEQFGCEGLGNTIPAFIPEVYDALSDPGKFAYLQRLVETYVMSNAHLKINNSGDVDRTLVYVMDRLINENPDKVRKSLEERCEDPWSRSYQYAYAGSHAYEGYAQRLAPKPVKVPLFGLQVGETKDMRPEFIRAELEHPRTPVQVARLVRQLEVPEHETKDWGTAVWSSFSKRQSQHAAL